MFYNYLEVLTCLALIPNWISSEFAEYYTNKSLTYEFQVTPEQKDVKGLCLLQEERFDEFEEEIHIKINADKQNQILTFICSITSKKFQPENLAIYMLNARVNETYKVQDNYYRYTKNWMGRCYQTYGQDSPLRCEKRIPLTHSMLGAWVFKCDFDAVLAASSQQPEIVFKPKCICEIRYNVTYKLFVPTTTPKAVVKIVDRDRRERKNQVLPWSPPKPAATSPHWFWPDLLTKKKKWDRFSMMGLIVMAAFVPGLLCFLVKVIQGFWLKSRGKWGPSPDSDPCRCGPRETWFLESEEACPC